MVTMGAWRIEVHGSHVHTFANPHGLVFRIGCFSTAPGCVHADWESDDFTWFPGFSWSPAQCAGCGAHLGWRFSSGSSAFHGLILDRLLEVDPGERGGGSHA